MNASDKVKAQTEAFTASTVAFCEDAPYFEPTDDALDMETKAGKRPVSAFFLAGQRMMLGRFSRQEAVGV